MINSVKVKPISEETRETEQMIADYFTGVLEKRIKDIENRLETIHDTLQGVKYNSTKVQTSNISDKTGNRAAEIEDISKKLWADLAEAKDKKVVMDAMIHSEFIRPQEKELMKLLYNKNRTTFAEIARKSGYRNSYKVKAARKKLIEEIQELMR